MTVKVGTLYKMKKKISDQWTRPVKKALLMVNQAAGTGSAKGKVFSIISELTKLGYEVVTFPILPEFGITSENVVYEYRRYDFKLVACIGGDGTLNHVINALMQITDQNKISIPIIYIPSGTTNDYARTLGLTGDIDKIVYGVRNGRVYKLDIGCFNGDYFNYVAAFGAFTNISYETPQNQKHTFGYLAYLLNGIASVPTSLQARYHMTVTHDGETEEGDFIFGAVSNATSVGGFKTQALASASLSDGLFEIVLIKAPDDLQEVGEILLAVKDGNFSSPYVRVFQAEKVRFESAEEVNWTLDGEFGGRLTEVEVTVLPGAVRIYAEE